MANDDWNHLGFDQMNDLIFRQLYPKTYFQISNSLSRLYKERRVAIQNLREGIKACIPQKLVNKISTQLIGPHQYLYNRQEVDKVLDYIVVETSEPIDCYHILGEIHTRLRSIPLTIRDYISNPKANGWRGLQTKVIVNGEQVQVNIVTRDFHDNNRRGVITLINEGIYQSQTYHQFLQLYLDAASDEAVRIEDVFRFNKAKTIQTLTPRGDVIELRYGATILDFAFMIHTDLGLKCLGGIADNVRYPRNKILDDGMVVTVLTADNVIAEKGWENEVVMPKSRSAIIRHLNRTKQQ